MRLITNATTLAGSAVDIVIQDGIISLIETA